MAGQTDYAVVLTNEITMELEDGTMTTIKAGELVVQRGTVHKWYNKTDENTRTLPPLVANANANGSQQGSSLLCCPVIL